MMATLQEDMYARAGARAVQRATQLTGQISPPVKARGMSTGLNVPNHILNTGASIPALGFGTWQDKEEQEPAVLAALAAGYRHIDTARIYGTELAVGRAIKKSGVPREEIFVTTKLWNHKHHPEDVAGSLDASLKDLGMDYVDLYLMHWPVAWSRGEHPFPKRADKKGLQVEDTDYIDTWKAMEALYKSGKAKAIGISNFSKGEVERLLSKASVGPAVHQMELHPWLQQTDFIEFHKQKNIHVTAYSPFGNANTVYDKGQKEPLLMEEPTLVEIGKKYGKSGAQVALKWGIQRGGSVIPKSKTESRIKQNGELEFTLTDEEMKRIGGLDRKLRLNDPSDTFGWTFYSDLDGKQ